jgi:phosphoenolpyruvate synthase/pyruvate phosphate dikinase
MESPQQEPFRFLDDGDAWMLAEDIPDLDFFFSQVWLRAFGNVLENSIGTNYRKILCLYEGFDLKFYYGEKDAERVAQAIFDKLVADPAWGEHMTRRIVELADALLAQSQRVRQNDLALKTNRELWELYEEHVRAHLRLYEYGWLPVALDMFYPKFTDHLKAYLRGKARGDEAKVNEWHVTLTSPGEETVTTREGKNLLRIALKAQASDQARWLAHPWVEARQHLSPDLAQALEEHTAAYGHMVFLYHGIPAGAEHYHRQLQELLAGDKDLAEEHEKIDRQIVEARQKREALLNELGIDEQHARLFRLFGRFMTTKWHRRDCQIRALQNLEPLLAEIGRRFNLSLMMVRNLAWEEVRAALLDHRLPAREELEARSHAFAFYVEKGRYLLVTGQERERLEKMVQPAGDYSHLTELKGQVACLGKAKGRVKVILRAADMGKMNQGDILVSIATDPDVVPAMKKAAAIVTEQGGVTSHAAIVSREFGIPCVIGTKIATKALRDDDLVDVDATTGVIKILERASK